MMEVIQSEFEIGHVSESISLPLKGSNFVVDSLDDATRDVVEVIVEQLEALVGSADRFHLSAKA